MKYLFINSLAGKGSTGRIAAGKCRELMAQGHQCLIAYGREQGNCEDIPTLRIGSDLDEKIHGVLTRTLDFHGFGSYRATKTFLEKVRQYDPDVIWLHNIHGYYLHIGLLFEYLKTCGKPIYWTLHDCWSFTGHCAYFDYAGCDKWKSGCHDCPEKRAYPASFLLDGSRRNYAKKRTLFTGVPNLTLITPSKWLAGLVKQSFLREYPVEVVYNTVDTRVFRPTPGDFRDRHGLTDKKMLLGVANVWDARKGMRYFLELAKLLDDRYRIVLVGVTPEQAGQLPEKFIPISRTDSPRQLAEIYTAADVFVNPTCEDNLPTVNLEAVACGCRVVCFDTGGCAETLGPEDILVPKGDVEALRQQVTALCEAKPETGKD